ncbi:glycosyltransferase family 39 protein [Candidatus Bathyarchaeota archaeon]|nr:glycosyltransferase family 39 protein [Candidatus Bathyarchaeota archaeon]
MIAIISVALIFSYGFLIFRIIFPIEKTPTIAEKIALWFCFGTVVMILNTFILGLTNLLFYLPLILILQIFILLVISLIKQKHHLRFALCINRFQAFLFLLIIILFLSVSARTVDFLRNSDEYKNAFWAKKMIENNILTAGTLGREGIDAFPSKSVLENWSWLERYVYGLCLVYFFQTSSYSLLNGQILSALFYSMLILATFLLSSTRDEKTGLIAAIFTAFNPMIFVFSNHLMTDIPTAAFTTFSLYFFIKSYEGECVDKQRFLIALVFAGLALFTKPTSLFIYPLISLYAFKNNISKGKIETLLRFSPLLMFLTVFSADWVRCYLIQHPNPSWNIFTQALTLVTFSINDWSNYLFTSPTGAYGTFVFPYFYTHGILLLALLGITNVVIKERTRLNVTFLSILVFTLWLFTTSAILGGTVRRIFIVFPLIMYFAALGLKSRNYLSLSLVPFFLLLMSIPEQGYVPYIQSSTLPENFRLIIKSIGATVVCLKIAEWLLGKRIKKLIVNVISTSKEHIFSIPFYEITCIAILFVTISASLYSGYFYVNNGPVEINETITIETVGIKQAIEWIDANVPSGSKIATNIIFEFPFYLSYLLAKNYTVINIPATYNYSQEEAHEAFFNLTFSGEPDYLIIFTSMGYWHWYPYLKDYLNNPPPRMYEIYRSENFVVYRTWSEIGESGWKDDSFSENWTYGWSRDQRGSYQMASYGFKTDGDILHMFGLSQSNVSDNRTWAHWITISTSNLSVNITTYPYLVCSFMTANSNTSTQVGVVIDGKDFYPINFATSTRWTIMVVDLRRYAESGILTEVFIRARAIGENMTINAYFDYLVLSSG